MKIWDTKYCLTAGIVERDAEVIDGDIAVVRDHEAGYTMYIYGDGENWHRSKEAAVIRAEKVRIKKLQSIDKQARKISAIVF